VGSFEQTYDGWAKRIHPEDVARLTPYFQEWMQSDREEEKEPQEFRIPLPGGQMRWIKGRGRIIRDASGRAVRLIGTNRDITRQKQSEDALRQKEAFLRMICETTPDPIFAKDRESRMLMANPATLRAFGKPLEEVLGRTDAELYVDPETVRSVIENDRRVIASGVAEVFEETIETPYGKRIFLSTKAPFRDAEGRIIGTIGVARDITERKAAEEALQQAKENAEAANQAKDRFLAILSHELRTPLTPALMTVSAHETDATLTPEMRQDLSTVRRNLELEARLIDDLLDLNRLVRGKIELHVQPRDLHRVVRNVLEICRTEIEAKGILVRLELTATEHNVNGDTGRLQQVFWNLLKNATKFTSQGGIIMVRSFTPHPGAIRVEVSDSGIGINPQVIPRLFVAFEQGELEANQQFGGLGLGLAICKAVVDLHNGRIWAESEGPGKGATFSVEIPVTSSQLSSEERARPANPAISLKQGNGDRTPRILLVEDNEDTLRILSRLLERAGCKVVSVQTAGAALGAAQSAREAGPSGAGAAEPRRVAACQRRPAEGQYGPSRQRGAFSHHGGGRAGLRDFRSQRGRAGGELECWSPADQRVSRRGDRWPTFFLFLYPGRTGGGTA